MPTFPTYRGELPECLNPLNPRHYLMLLDWVYFKPSHLKQYLYHADPELYQAKPGQPKIRQVLGTRAYRSLYLAAIMLPLLFTVVLTLCIIVLLIFVLIVIAFLTGEVSLDATEVSRIAWDVAGLYVGVLPFGLLTALVATGMGLVAFVLADLFLGHGTFTTAGAIIASVTLGIAGGVFYSAAIIGVLANMIGMPGHILGMALGTLFGMALGIGMVSIWHCTPLLSIPYLLLVVSIWLGFARDIPGFESRLFQLIDINSFVLSSLSGFLLGLLRLPFYPLHFFSDLWATDREGKHPICWDELLILPLPGMRRMLTQLLHIDEEKGIWYLADVSRKSFHRWSAQSVLYRHLHRRPDPLGFFYRLLAHPTFDEYVFTPILPYEWDQGVAVGKLLLGELAAKFVYGTPGLVSLEHLAWWLTRFLRARQKSSLTRFAGMLYELLDEDTVGAGQFDLSAYAVIYTSLTGYPGGDEIARSFEALATFLSYDSLPALPAAVGVASRLADTHNPIRPAVLAALTRLGEVGAEVATYRDSTSRVNQLAALARATDALDNLDEYIVAEVMAPEQYILRRIIRQWRRLVSEAGGEVGRAEEMRPVANPYVVANPVVAELFVGREDILRRLEELWAGEGQCPSVVLYGHRRMGKSSILHNLGARFGARTLVVDFNMQRVGLVINTGELLHNLALALYDSLSAQGERLEGGEPEEEHFTIHNPYTAFDRFLRRLDRARGQRRFIVTVDEFELIEKMIAEGQLEPHLLDFWRGLIQTYPWFIMAFAGLHTLQEMTHDYWHPLYGSVTAIPVSFLGHGAAWQLITQPSPDFPIDYDTEAVERVIALTSGQPYLVQLIGHGLVTRFNRQAFEEGVERERRFSPADVEAVIGAPEFFRDGDAYFTGVWRQAETGQPSGQTAVLRTLAHAEAGMTEQEIARQARLASEQVKQALDTLKRHAVVMVEDSHWRFTVELMRRWVAGKEGNR